MSVRRNLIRICIASLALVAVLGISFYISIVRTETAKRSKAFQSHLDLARSMLGPGGVLKPQFDETPAVRLRSGTFFIAQVTGDLEEPDISQLDWSYKEFPIDELPENVTYVIAVIRKNQVTRQYQNAQDREWVYDCYVLDLASSSILASKRFFGSDVLDRVGSSTRSHNRGQGSAPQPAFENWLKSIVTDGHVSSNIETIDNGGSLPEILHLADWQASRLSVVSDEEYYFARKTAPIVLLAGRRHILPFDFHSICADKRFNPHLMFGGARRAYGPSSQPGIEDFELTCDLSIRGTFEEVKGLASNGRRSTVLNVDVPSDFDANIGTIKVNVPLSGERKDGKPCRIEVHIPIKIVNFNRRN